MSADSAFRLLLVPVDRDRTPLVYALSVIVAGETIWPNVGDPDHTVDIQLDDLFSFLVEFWKPLLLRQTYPFALAPERPCLLASDAARKWANTPIEQADEEASELDAFEEAHNVALSFGGTFDLPPLWLFRQGEHMLCDTGKSFVRLPFEVVRDELEATGNWISNLLLHLNQSRWSRIVDAWSKRDRGSDVSLVSWAASIEEDVASKLIHQGLIQSPSTFAEVANDNDELLIAARFAGALPYENIAEILEIARSFRLHRAEGLEIYSAKVIEYLHQLEPREPYAEGEALAIFVRGLLGIGSVKRVDVFKLMKELGVEIRIDAIGPVTFDGLAIAGNRFGPGAFINRNGGRIREKSNQDLSANAGVRITLAHEFCHLLVDRNHPLSAVEVLRSRMPANIESRARAFAGELLLPTTTAAKVWDEAGSPTDQESLRKVLQSLADDYEVSFSVAAWKLEHGARWGLENGGGEQFRRLRAVLDVLAFYR